METTYDYAMLAEKVPEVNDDPKDVEEARSHLDWPEWKMAMDAETFQLKNLGTYIKVKIPEDRVAINCKWVFHLTHNVKDCAAQSKIRCQSHRPTQFNMDNQSAIDFSKNKGSHSN